MNFFMNLVVRFRRFGSRRGSVLILCVVLIVILALIGTAMLSRARIDRVTSVQNTNNTEIDLLVEGARDIAKSVIINDLYDGTVFRPARNAPFPRPVNPANPPNPTRITSYENWDAPNMTPTIAAATFPEAAVPNASQNDTWLASRLPVVPNYALEADGTVNDMSAGSNYPYWPAITAPMSALSGVFEAPLVSAGTITTWKQQTSYTSPVTNGRLEPTTFNNYPAFIVEINGQAVYVVAGDADGDGIADCGLQKLPIGEINQITYYYGFRIIDNNSSINVNTALRRDFDYDGVGVKIRPQGFFTTNIGLAELLHHTTGTIGTAGELFGSLGEEMDQLNNYRLGTPVTTTPVSPPNGVVIGTMPPLNPPPAGTGPFKDDGTAESSFMYMSCGDAITMSLGRRLGNPGLNGPSSATDKYERASASESAALAYHFCLANPAASKSQSEVMLADSLKGPTLPQYGAASVIPWFNDNFNYSAESGAAPTYMPRRALLVTSNPVSNLMPAHEMTLALPYGVVAGMRFNPPDVPLKPSEVWPPLPPEDGKMLNCSSDIAGGGTFTGYSPARANINTAYFGELWRAFWNVMIDQTQPTGTPFVTPTNAEQTYWGSSFEQSIITDPAPKYAPVTGLAAEAYHQQRMFRSPVRDMRHASDAVTGPQVYIKQDQVLLLRAALAAVNTQDLRDREAPGTAETSTEREIPLSVQVDGTATNVLVSIYGYEPQPFITEIYANTDSLTGINVPDPANPGGEITITNPKGYVAIELYNPYPFAIDISGWCVVVLNRNSIDAADTMPNPYPSGNHGFDVVNIRADPATPGDPFQFPSTTTIPAHGFFVLENHSPSAPAGPDSTTYAQYRPTRADAGNFTNRLYVPNLHWVMQGARTDFAALPETRGGELLLLRPKSGAVVTPFTINNYIPVDSFDFSGMRTKERYDEDFNTGPGTGQYVPLQSWHYVRSNTTTGQAAEPNWKFVYPGRYDGRFPANRHQGTEASYFGDLISGIPEATFSPAVQLGMPDTTATYPSVHTIQLGNTDWPGPNAVPATPRNAYPFGGFARNGDILQVPFIGIYKIVDATDANKIYEINSITMDSVFAEDTDVNDDEVAGDDGTRKTEQIGRFGPVCAILGNPNPDPGDTAARNDFDPTGSYDFTNTSVPRWNYRWARDLFEYLTVQSPNDDYLPNPPQSGPAGTSFPNWPNQPQPVSNSTAGATANRLAEENEPIEGQININTAPWIVLKQLPWMPVLSGTTDLLTYDPAGNPQFTVGGDGADDNEQIARAIVSWRDGEPAGGTAAQGPFETIFDLYKMPAFRSFNQALTTGQPMGPDNDTGDLSPYGATLNDNVRRDFEEQYLALNRVSNLITTRSDSFTVYIVVQGWRAAGTPQAKLEVQRRAAFIIDRSTMTPASSSVKITPVAND